jgi:putative DNA methylase
MSLADHRLRIHKQLFGIYDKYLDDHREIAWLSDPRIAALVRKSLYHLHSRKYYLLAYTIMPNHVHVLFLPLEIGPTPDAESLAVGECDDMHSPLASIMHSLKSYTAHEANKVLGRAGQFWQHESYDHWVRDDDELERIVEYIDNNAVTAKLATSPQLWLFCSAHDRYLTDGIPTGWLSLET